MSNILGCKVGDFPFDYLGIKVGANMNRVCHWSSVVETVSSRLSKWKADSLSMGGRLTLIKSVLSNLPIYYLSLYKAPVEIVEQIERLMRSFLWGGSNGVNKMHWVSWDIVTSPKSDEGLGISRLSDVNIALITKLAWRFKRDPHSSWRRTIEAIHGGKGRWRFFPINNSQPGCWKSMITLVGNLKLGGKEIHNIIRGSVGSGTEVSFWHDIWYGMTNLCQRWPCLFSLEKKQKMHGLGQITGS
ncbi:hypothetical protein HanRHA438_Chr07g0306431 [Helianthus annuus]|uniref:Reverse transcriptase domain, Reverse transcriptase zinc-binding domain protein n=2 Tax=Helianthus annuus TaxID=4232 RepID=A0A9K3IKW7_HELAN|nr:hypothetical protein HanXRQr2_Chr07g0296071 [Helianthus annuus]KAJ0550279.1 hypothetical protein HanHA300_Chr07g0243611 [Helianthus annuus]KAJ0556956.1 hypothetical protein HanIR_Chr07g0319671 [Helianthus annuus]KAJ0563232.1 hypothetical protein HanHA89_Chr07g0260781 [Helianthus annuus]KAJ0728588.1 hypothetical protein HanLR1_Chr07g0243331 [Helianthus annuus]